MAAILVSLDQKISATVSFMSRLSPSSDRLSLNPYSWVSLSLAVSGKTARKRSPMMKLGLMQRSVKKLSKMKESMYMSLVMKPSMPRAKWRIEVGKSSMLQIARKVFPKLMMTLTKMSSSRMIVLLRPWCLSWGWMKQNSRWLIPATTISFLITVTLPKLTLVRIEAMQAMISMKPASETLKEQEAAGLSWLLALMKQLRLINDHIALTIITLMRIELYLKREAQEWCTWRDEIVPPCSTFSQLSIFDSYSCCYLRVNLPRTRSFAIAIFSIIILASLCRCLVTQNLGESRIFLQARQRSTARGSKVRRKITLQFTRNKERMPIMICPIAQPIEQIMGVIALMTFPVTSAIDKNAALQKPLKPALKKKTPKEKSQALPARKLRRSPPTIMPRDSKTAHLLPLRSMTSPQQRLPMKPPQRKAEKQVLRYFFLQQTRPKLQATLFTSSLRLQLPLAQTASSEQSWSSSQINCAGWKKMGKPICMNAAKRKAKKKLPIILN